jgi:hypothetical protein
MALHNFVRNHAMYDAKFQPYDDDEDLLPPEIIGDNEEQRRDKLTIIRDIIFNLLRTH